MLNNRTIWLIPLTTAILLGLILLVVQRLGQERTNRKIKNYRRLYLTLVSRLERFTLLLNQMSGGLARENPRGFLNHYEALLKRFEAMLTLVKDIAPFGVNLAIVKSGHDSLNELDKHLVLLAQWMKQGSYHPPERYTADAARIALPLGCYFCSRPFTYTGLQRVKAKIEGRSLTVSSCTHCRKDLDKQQKVKVLYFIKDGTPKHWSEVSEYNPATDFATLQTTNKLFPTRKLELVISRDD